MSDETEAGKVKGFTIAHKGLVLVSAPVVLVLVFVGLVALLKSKTEQAQAWSAHSKDVIALARLISRDITEAGSAVRGYYTNRDPAFAESYERSIVAIPESVSSLKSIVEPYPEQKERVHLLCERALKTAALVTQAMTLVRAGQRERAVEEQRSPQNRQILEEYRTGIASFIAEEERLDVERRAALDKSWRQLNWALIGGAIVAVLLTLVLAVLFTKGITRRLFVLTENARRLASGERLATQVRGTDEIAHLDRVFHKVALTLEEAARKERAVVHHALDVICSVDSEGRFVSVSPACYRVWGYTANELVGRPYLELVAPEDVDGTVAAGQRIISGEPVTDFENRCIHKQGHMVNVMWTSNWSEVDQLMYAVARDITGRRRAEQAVRDNEALLKAVLDTIPVGVWVVDRTGKLILDNSSAQSIIGLENGASAGSATDQEEPFRIPDEWGLNHALNGNASVGEVVDLVRGDSPRKTLLCSAVPMRNQQTGIVGAILVGQDITEIRRAGETIKDLHRALERHADQLMLANKELEAFSYSVSHDLRAPLRHISGFADLLVKQAGGLDEKGRRYVAIISESATRLGQLIDDLLAFSRMGRAELQDTVVDLETLATDVMEQLSAEEPQRVVKFQNGNLPMVHGDRAMLRQVLVNLLSNALKYSNIRTETRIEVGCIQDDPDELVIFVRDNGVGFDMRYVDKLFGVFQRLHSGDEFSGTGIGLANVRRIISRHGGRTWGEGKVGDGATFYFSLPKTETDNYE
jgi:PAS domain S-box-containing protein